MRNLMLASFVTLLCGAALSCGSPSVKVDGTSTAEIKLPKGAKLKIPAGTKWKTKEGVELVIPEPGVEIDAGEGGTFTISDKVVSSGQAAQDQRSGRVSGSGVLLAGSSYRFAFPAALGAVVSDPVPLTGAYSYVARADALVPGPGGTQVLDPAAVLAFTYHVDGPAPSWRLPLLGTPLGDFDGVGAIEGEPFSVDFDGNIGALSGTLDGSAFTLSIPLQLTMASGGGGGAETEVGSVRIAPEVVVQKPLAQ